MSWLDHWFGTAPKTDEEIRVERKKTVIEGLHPRQREFHDSLKGASQTEVILVLEKRIHDLEQIVYAKTQVPEIDIPLPIAEEPVIEEPIEVPVALKVRKSSKLVKMPQPDPLTPSEIFSDVSVVTTQSKPKGKGKTK